MPPPGQVRAKWVLVHQGTAGVVPSGSYIKVQLQSQGWLDKGGSGALRSRVGNELGSLVT